MVSSASLQFSRWPGSVHHFGPHEDHVGGMASVLRVLRQERIGAERVITHATWVPEEPVRSAALTARALLELGWLRRDDVVHVHLSEGGSFVREGAVLRAAHLRGLRTVATLHGADFEAFARSHPTLAGATLRAASCLTALSPTALAVAQRLAPHARCQLVANPVVMDPDPTSAGATDPVVLFAGELSARKGADVLLEAWAGVPERVPGARCVMVGPPSDVDVRTLPGLEVRAPVDRDDMRALMRDARLVVLPSRAEAMPMALLEAMATGRPFVATPVGGVPELADAGGTLVPVGDPLALREALVGLLEAPEAAAALGERGRAHTDAHRSAPVVSGVLAELYVG